MSWRVVYITEPSKLRLQDNALVIEKEQTHRVPLEDISTIVIETLQSTVSTQLLSQLSKHKIAVVICDDTHTPNGVLYHIGAHCRHPKVAKAQINTTSETKGLLWQQITRRKLLNQAKCVELCVGEEQALKLYEYADNVLPNDNGCVEGYAAAYYFSVLYKNFKRDTEALVDVRNAAMNYGYALIRANIIRSIAAVGLLPVFGIKHDSELNPFNLADDLIESFRPFIDKIVFENFDGKDTDRFLEKSDKVELLGIFSQKFSVDGKRLFLSSAIEAECESLVNVFFGNKKQLLLPEFV
ncbi:MAG: type II CRISPR-associated endonuclease Cas1 [Campylobacterales bacterium]|nr:type II CRISPR-associated endonuclease Cas1 [Campylobacterales bacterium]